MNDEQRSQNLVRDWKGRQMRDWRLDEREERRSRRDWRKRSRRESQEEGQGRDDFHEEPSKVTWLGKRRTRWREMSKSDQVRCWWLKCSLVVEVWSSTHHWHCKHLGLRTFHEVRWCKGCKARAKGTSCRARRLQCKGLAESKASLEADQWLTKSESSLEVRSDRRIDFGWMDARRRRRAKLRTLALWSPSILHVNLRPISKPFCRDESWLFLIYNNHKQVHE